MNRKRFERFLKKLPEYIYRAKGIVKFSEDSWSSLFNYTCGRIQMDWLARADGETFQNRAVVIGKNLQAMESQIVYGLKKCLE